MTHMAVFCDFFAGFALSYTKKMTRNLLTVKNRKMGKKKKSQRRFADEKMLSKRKKKERNKAAGYKSVQQNLHARLVDASV
jgi:hypothetical protein